jgi:GH15 family glucan-1,4-alpha-glucosidase
MQFDEFIDNSVSIILKYQESSGAYPACPYFPNYQYSWFRDGSFIADSMSRVSQIESAEKFFKWCSDIIVKRKDHILSGELLDARYTYDGNEVGNDWGNFQLDGFGTFLCALKAHENRHNRSIEQYREAFGLIQFYLAKHWQEPCFDWWEENKGIHAATLTCIHAGLDAFKHPDAPKVKMAIKPDAERTDASLLICGILGSVTENEFSSILLEIEEKLVSKDGGVYRYTQDTYYGGGEWPVLAAMLGLYYSKIGRMDEARQKLDWIKSLSNNDGWLPEQSNKNMLHPGEYSQWIDKWGKSANPLLWSHAMAISLALDI